MRLAVNGPAPRPVALRAVGGAHRPPDAAVAGRVPRPCDDPPEVRLGSFTERLMIEHVSAPPPPRRGLGRWLRGGRERRLPPGSAVRALTASSR